MGFLGFLKQNKIRRLAREWQFFTKTSSKDYEFKTQSPYEKQDNEGNQLWNKALSLSIRAMSKSDDIKEVFTQAKSKKLALYVYLFRDGRRDFTDRAIHNYLILKLTPEEASKYTIKDFANDIYSKKSSLKMLYPTGFDFVDQFPVTWDDKEPMESHNKAFLKSHPSAYEDDFAFEKKDFQKGNNAWRESKMDNAVFVDCKEND